MQIVLFQLLLSAVRHVAMDFDSNWGDPPGDIEPQRVRHLRDHLPIQAGLPDRELGIRRISAEISSCGHHLLFLR